MSETLEQQIIRIVAEDCPLVPDDGIQASTRFAEDLKFDSLDSVEFVMRLEEVFEIIISDPDAEACSTVGDVVALVEKLMPATTELIAEPQSGWNELTPQLVAGGVYKATPDSDIVDIFGVHRNVHWSDKGGNGLSVSRHLRTVGVFRQVKFCVVERLIEEGFTLEKDGKYCVKSWPTCEESLVEAEGDTLELALFVAVQSGLLGGVE